MLYNQAIQLPVYPIDTYTQKYWVRRCFCWKGREGGGREQKPPGRHWPHHGTSLTQNVVQRLKRMRQGWYTGVRKNVQDTVLSKSSRKNKRYLLGTSLVAQWLKICLPMQGTQVGSLVREGLTCRGATKPVRHNYWACALEPASYNYWAHVPQLLKPTCLEPLLCNKGSHRNEKPTHRN